MQAVQLPPTVLYEVRERAAYVSINRPSVLNAMDAEVRSGLDRAIEAFEGNDEVLVAVLSGEGGRAFSSGADLNENVARNEASGRSRPVRGARQGSFSPYDRLENCRKPIIAAIDGYCLAGGFELALMCDIRVATRASTFGLPEPRRSLLGASGLHNLSRMIPLGEAMRLQLTGGVMSSERAYQIGLVQELADDRRHLFDTVVADLVAEMLECAPLAVQAIKQIVKVGRNLPIEYSWKFSYPLQELIGETEDYLEGPKAFIEKRPPRWKMR